MSKPQVIFCTDGIFPHVVGGIQRHSRLLIETLAKSEEVDLIVIHPHQGERVFTDYPSIKEITVEPIPGKRNYLLELYDYSKRVYEVVKQYPEHLLYAQGLTVWYKVAELQPRLIVNPHGLEPYQGLSFKDKLKGLPYRLIFNHIFNRSARVVALGGKLTTIISSRIKSPKSNVAVLPNAIFPAFTSFPRQESDFSETPINVLFVGRFAENKGINVLLDAIQELNQSGIGKDFFFSLVGKGPLYETYTSTYQIENVKFWGFVSDEELSALYLSHHLFILPTLFEGMPTVVLEAMSHGIPIIVTDVGATKEMVAEENGFIIEKKSAQHICETLKTYQALPEEKKYELGQNSFQKVIKAFTWEKVAKKHLELFRELM